VAFPGSTRQQLCRAVLFVSVTGRASPLTQNLQLFHLCMTLFAFATGCASPSCKDAALSLLELLSCLLPQLAAVTLDAKTFNIIPSLPDLKPQARL